MKNTLKKNVKLNQKMTLNKETIANLNSQEMANLYGGESGSWDLIKKLVPYLVDITVTQMSCTYICAN